MFMGAEMGELKRVALVTGANRGIGFEIVKGLAKAGITVVLTARDANKGQQAIDTINDSRLDIIFHTLDVTSESDISAKVQLLKNQFGHIDILVNNAAILIDENESALTISSELMQKALDTNFTGPLRLCQAVIPMMKKMNYGRIVNVSSGMGSFHEMGGGYPSYRISKTALNAMTKILASEVSGSNILINSMCPGWVHTDMGGPDAPRTPEQGADTAIWLAQLPDGGPTGDFFRDRTQISW